VLKDVLKVLLKAVLKDMLKTVLKDMLKTALKDMLKAPKVAGGCAEGGEGLLKAAVN
jgi:hypothetical protein